YQRFRGDERGVRHILHGAVSGTHDDPSGRAAGRHRRRDRVRREERSIVDALDLDTPALHVYLDALEHNIARLQGHCRAWAVAPEWKAAGRSLRTGRYARTPNPESTLVCS